MEKKTSKSIKIRFSDYMFTIILIVDILLDRLSKNMEQINTMYAVIGGGLALLIYLVLAIYLIYESRVLYRAFCINHHLGQMMLRGTLTLTTCVFLAFLNYLFTSNLISAFWGLW